MLFSANDVTHGRQLWRSNGAAAGTMIVGDINLASGSVPTSFTVVNGTTFFVANEEELWRTNGTTAGTVMVKDFGPGSTSPYALTNVNGTLFFRASDGLDYLELWRSDGTATGTFVVKDISSERRIRPPPT